MFARFKNSIITSYNQESLPARLERVKRGAIFGVFGATVYVAISSTVNLFSFPSLHLAIDWPSFFTFWLGMCLAMAAAGAIAGWPTEEYVGIVGGGVLMTLLILIANTILFFTSHGGEQSYIQVLVTTLPLVVFGVLLSWGFRWSINRHLYITKEETPRLQRKLYIQLFSIIFFAGLVPGIFGRYDLSIVTALTALNDHLDSTDPVAFSKVRFPESIAQTIETHYGSNYVLMPRQSSFSIGALDVTIKFDDGYIVTCIVPTDGSQYLFIPFCSEGRKILVQ
ncbi:MAG: hypothetical protein FD147_1131 [Chloroflexi bacterium]|nr:MAG: hypothetical protein FD147_1131 [Chloroflexota bacterium]